MTEHSEKLRKSIIEIYGDWETYKAIRYHNPKAKADQKRAASLGGKASSSRPFKDPVKALEGYNNGIGKKHRETSK